jgi:uncharacterized lipoprotein NlpE involved in copper resistance
MKNKKVPIAIGLILVSILVGCDNKTENNSNTIKATSEHTDIEIINKETKNQKEKSYRTITFYNENKNARKQRIKECRKLKKKTLEIEKDCQNAKKSIQISKRKNTNSFIDQKFL